MLRDRLPAGKPCPQTTSLGTPTPSARLIFDSGPFVHYSTGSPPTGLPASIIVWGMDILSRGWMEKGGEVVIGGDKELQKTTE